MKKVFDWTVGSFFRTIGRIIAFIVIGYLVATLLSLNGFQLTELFFTKVNASEQITKWAVIYTDSNRTTQGISATLTSNLDMNYTTTKFYWPNNSTNVYDYQGGYVIIPFTVQAPILSINYANTLTTEEEECQKWTQTTQNGQTAWICSYFSSNTNSNTLQDREYITPTIAIKAKLYTIHNNISYNVACFVESGSLKCPINYGVDYMDYIQIESNVNYGSTTVTKQYKLEITNFIIVEYDGTKQAIQSQTQQQQQQHQEMMDSNTTQAEEQASDFFDDFTVPDVGGLSAIITAPLSTIQSLLNSTCTPLVLPLPFVDEDLTLPCLNAIYTEHFGAFFTLYQTIILGIIAYRCILSIFFDIKGFTNPNDDRIEVKIVGSANLLEQVIQIQA